MNIQHLMKQAQNMQKKMQEEQVKLEQTDFEGGSNGIKIVMNGKYVCKKLTIEDSLLDDKETLEDLLIVAINDVTSKIEKETNSSAANATGGFKLPF
ncbi:MAG: YbaB/EbfC family nucleoid-associated protein [Rickettsiales bacterium]|nr:MAG: YbaB/EbfC family nucleoid-associated protein [Rickettsiales bacterium]